MDLKRETGTRDGHEGLTVVGFTHTQSGGLRGKLEIALVFIWTQPLFGFLEAILFISLSTFGKIFLPS